MKCYQCSNNLQGRWQKKFCSKSCAASYNNARDPKRQKTGSCRECQGPSKATRAFCTDCVPEGIGKSEAQKLVYTLIKKGKIAAWLKGEWRGGTDYGLSHIVRNFLLDQAEHSCSKCGWDTPHPDTGEVPLEVNHIDGDGLNHDPSNVEVICPNCHSLTSSYRGRNIGNGRPFYYHRIAR